MSLFGVPKAQGYRRQVDLQDGGSGLNTRDEIKSRSRVNFIG